jgi:hypothetical protein
MLAVLTDFVFHNHEEFAKWYPEGRWVVGQQSRQQMVHPWPPYDYTKLIDMPLLATANLLD